MDTAFAAASPPHAPRAAEPPTAATAARAPAEAPESVAAATPPQTDAERQAPVAPRPTSGAYVTLNVRVSIEIDQLISRAMAETGMTKRAAVENALLRTYG
jgi:hypothetical protein